MVGWLCCFGASDTCDPITAPRSCLCRSAWSSSGACRMTNPFFTGEGLGRGGGAFWTGVGGRVSELSRGVICGVTPGGPRWIWGTHVGQEEEVRHTASWAGSQKRRPPARVRGSRWGLGLALLPAPWRPCVARHVPTSLILTRFDTEALWLARACSGDCAREVWSCGAQVLA